MGALGAFFQAHAFIRLLQWSIKLHSGSGEALLQYRANLTAIAVHLERLAHHAEVYWVLQGTTGLQGYRCSAAIKIWKKKRKQYSQLGITVFSGLEAAVFFPLFGWSCNLYSGVTKYIQIC